MYSTDDVWVGAVTESLMTWRSRRLLEAYDSEDDDTDGMEEEQDDSQEQDLDDSEQHCCAHCGMLGGCVNFSATANNLIGRFASNRT
jgi:hypothetical protein